MILGSALLVAGFIPIHLPTAAAERWEPWPTCWTCVSRSKIISPAIGIDIEPTYLTASIRYHNGTISNLIKLDGSAEYQNLMRTLASPDRETPNAETLSQKPSPASYPVQHQHYLDRRSPPPPHHLNDAIHILSSALIALKASIRPLLPLPFPANNAFPPALPTYPNFPGLTYALISSAMSAAEILLLGDARTPPVGAAAAANDLGLCDNYTELDVCGHEEARMPMRRVLAVEYTSAALTVTLSPFRASRKGFDWMEVRDWGLGSDAVPQGEGEEARVRYWGKVRRVVQKIPAHVEPDRPVTDVIVMGEAALGETFLEVLSEALREVLPDYRGLGMGFADAAFADPTFAATRGAAEFGKRIMESPDDCVETRVCKWWRRMVG